MSLWDEFKAILRRGELQRRREAEERRNGKWRWTPTVIFNCIVLAIAVPFSVFVAFHGIWEPIVMIALVFWFGPPISDWINDRLLRAMGIDLEDE